MGFREPTYLVYSRTGGWTWPLDPLAEVGEEEKEGWPEGDIGMVWKLGNKGSGSELGLELCSCLVLMLKASQITAWSASKM
jgi:hypothetical protein